MNRYILLISLFLSFHAVVFAADAGNQRGTRDLSAFPSNDQECAVVLRMRHRSSTLVEWETTSIDFGGLNYAVSPRGILFAIEPPSTVLIGNHRTETSYPVSRYDFDSKKISGGVYRGPYELQNTQLRAVSANEKFFFFSGPNSVVSIVRPDNGTFSGRMVPQCSHVTGPAHVSDCGFEAGFLSVDVSGDKQPAWVQLLWRKRKRKFERKEEISVSRIETVVSGSPHFPLNLTYFSHEEEEEIDRPALLIETQPRHLRAPRSPQAAVAKILPQGKTWKMPTAVNGGVSAVFLQRFRIPWVSTQGRLVLFLIRDDRLQFQVFSSDGNSQIFEGELSLTEPLSQIVEDEVSYSALRKADVFLTEQGRIVILAKSSPVKPFWAIVSKEPLPF